MKYTRILIFYLCVAVLAAPGASSADDATEGATTGWSNSTDLSFVETAGNSDTQTFGLKETLTRTWKKSRLRFRVNAIKSDTADDRYAVAVLPPGFDPNNPPPGFDPEDLP